MSANEGVPGAQVLAETVVAALHDGGVRDVVLAPGSRSAPMAYALLAAEGEGALRLQVVLDERCAGFVALGLAAATGRPVAVVVTSGSAVANLHPAVVEAGHQRVPIVVISTDRPAELVARGASQTTEQMGMFGSGEGLSRPRAVAEVTSPGEVGGAVGHLLSVAAGPLPGPVQLNLPLADPLVPHPHPHPAPHPVRERKFVLSREEVRPFARRSSSFREAKFVASREEVRPFSRGSSLAPAQVLAAVAYAVAGERATIVIAADGAPSWAADLAATFEWPLLAEPTSGARATGLSVPTVLLEALGDEVRCAVVLGRPTLSRQVSRLLGRADVAVVILDPSGRPWLDVPGAIHLANSDELPLAVPPTSSRERTKIASRKDELPLAKGRTSTREWGERWRVAGEAVEAALTEQLTTAQPLAGWQVARLVSAQVRDDGGVLVAGASMAIRELDLAMAAGAHVVANRGVAGIDGTVSTAVGHALSGGPGPVRALLGDLTLQHDLGGLVRGRRERPVDLQLIVLNDDGGAIFATLEHGREDLAWAHERVFATPQRIDLSALAEAVGASYRRVLTLEDLGRVLGEEVSGLSVVDVKLERAGAATRRTELHAQLVAVARALR